MPTVPSTSASPAMQYGLSQLRLQQTRRNAEQAEQAAQSLQAQAAAARRDADQADEKARSLEVDAAKAQSSAASARQGLAMLQSTGDNEARLTRVSSNMVVQQSGQQSATSGKAPVVNAQGQVTGRVVNVTA